MGTSLTQIAANRRNAQKSTGPRTSRGKERIRFNALKHGLTSSWPIIPGEDPFEYQAFQDRLMAEISPEGEMAVVLAERLVALLWRARRVSGFEAALFGWIAARQAEIEDAPEDAGSHLICESHDSESQNKANHSRGRWLEEVLDRELAGRLARYESHLDRQIRNVVRDLEEMKGLV